MRFYNQCKRFQQNVPKNNCDSLLVKMSVSKISHMQQNQSDFYESKLMNSKSKKEFLKEYEKFNEKDARIFYLKVLTEIESSVIDGNVDKLKRLSNVISYVSCMKKSTIKNYFNDDSNPLKTTNLVILACKSNQVCVLQNIFSSDDKILSNLSTHSGRNLSPADEDETCHNAFYYAIRSNNVELLYTLLNWPGNFFDTHLDDLDRIISTSYEELKLKNVPLTDKMEFLVEKKILSLRFYSNSSEEDHETDLNNIKNRIELVLENIDLLKNDSSNTEVDESFIYIAKFVAQNIHVLKRQLKATYDRLPWEEMEFCLVCFVSSYLKQQEINLFFASTLDKRKILNHLEIFAEELKEIGEEEIGEEEIGMEVKRSSACVRVSDLAKLPKLNRNAVFTNITDINPQFKELYRDYHQIRDIYSLEKINTYVNLALSADTENREGQLIIMRALLVIGEHLKNTLESPNLSDATSDLILLSITRNTRKIIIDLRNSLSHADSLFKRIEIELNSDVNFFIGIQNDIKKVGDVISDILSNKKIKMIRALLEKIVSAENFDEIKRVIEIFNNATLEDNIKKDFKTTENQKLQKLINELSECMPTEARRNEELFQRINNLLNSTETKSKSMQISYNLGFLRIKNLKFLMSQIVDHNVIRVTKLQVERTLEIMVPTMDCHIIKKIADLSMEILINVKSKMNPDNIEEMERIIREIFYIAEYGTDSFEWIEELRENLCQNKNANFTHKQRNICNITKENYNILESRLIELKDILNRNLLSGELIEKIVLYKNDKSLQAVIEMLVLDILDILNHKLDKNYLFVDDNYLLLTGRCLRNYLAHDNILVTLLNDPSKVVLLNARKLTEDNIMKSKKKFGKLIKDDPLKLREKYKKNLEIITYQRRMFAALEGGDIENLKDCFRKGTDVSARNVNSWTTLHFAAKGQSLEIWKFVLYKNLNANSKDVNGQNPLHIAAAYGRTNNVSYLIEEAGLYVSDVDNFQISPVHLAAQNGHIDVIKVLLKYVSSIENACEILDYAVRNNHIEVVKLLLEQYPNAHLYEGEAGFTPLHEAAERGHIDIVKLLLQKNANANAKTDRNCTPLHLAALNGHQEVVNVLILNHACVNTEDLGGCTPLHYAVSNNHEETVELLLNHKANADVSHKTEKYTPLHIASERGFERVVEILLKYTAKASEKTAEEVTPMHLATQNGHLNVVRILLKSGVDFRIKGKFKATPLHYAAECGHREIAEILIEKGSEIDAKTFLNFTPLLFAASKGHKDVVELLVENNADINIQDSTGSSVLHVAVMNDSTDTIDFLIRNGADVNGRNKVGSTPLHEAALNGNKEAIRSLIENQATVNVTDMWGLTPLHVAAMKGKNDVVDFLIENNAEVNSKDLLNCTPLHLAVDNGHLDIINILIAKGADVNASRCKNLNTPLLSAIKYNNIEIVDILIANGADGNDGKGKPLHLAVVAGYRGIVENLLTKGARIDEKYTDEATLLHFAAERGHKAIVNILVKKGASIDAVTISNLTPLHLAAEGGYEDIVKILINKKANVNIKSDTGVTPLHKAAERGHKKVVELLLNNAANYDTKDDNNITPLAIAVKNGHFEVVKILFHQKKLDLKLNDDWTLLHIAAQGCNLEIVEFLVSCGYDINARNSVGLKPIHVAAKKGFKEAIEYFLNQGSDINDPDAFNATALHCASEENNLGIVEYLIDKGANINITNTDGLSSLHIAASFGYEDVVKVLVKNGASYDGVDNAGKKPLDKCKYEKIKNFLSIIDAFFQAVKRNDFLEVKKYINAGIVVDVKNHENETPLHYAAKKGFDKVVGILLENNASPNIINYKGFTPLHNAVKFSHLKIVKALLSHGAIFNAVSNDNEKPICLSIDKDISNLLKFVNELFEDIKKSDPVVLEKLKTVEDIDTMKAIMCACNEEQKTLTVFAIQQNFSNIEQLKEVLQYGASDLVKKALQLVNDGSYQKALDILNEVFKKRKAVLGSDNPGTLEIEGYIAFIFYKQGKYHKALSKFEKICLKQKDILGSDNSDTLDTRSSIALLLHELGRNEEAHDIFQEVYEKQKEVLGSDHENTLKTLFHFALVLAEQGKYEEALDIYKAGFEKWKEIARQGCGSVKLCRQRTVSAQNNIAMILWKQGKYEEALKIFKEVLEKQKVVFGTNHPDTLGTLQSIGIIFSEQKKYREALQTFQSLLTIQKSELGHDHPETLRTQYNLLVTLFNHGMYVGVLKVYNECFEKIEALFGSSHFFALGILDKMEKVRFRFKLDDCRAEQMLRQVQKNFITAVKDSDVTTVQSLLNYGVDVNGKDSDGKAPLHHAAHNGNINVMNMLLDNGADVNIKDNLGRTPLHDAVGSGQNGVVYILLEHGAIVTEITNKGNTPLHIAVLRNNKELIEILLNHVRSGKLEEFINAKTTSKGNTALHVATKNGSLEIVQILLNRGAIYEIENKASEKPLDISTNCIVTNLLSLLEELFEFAKEGNEEMIKKLTAVDTDKLFAIKKACNNEGYKLLRVAIKNGHKQMAYKLTELFRNK